MTSSKSVYRWYAIVSEADLAEGVKVRALLRALEGIREVTVIEPGPGGRPRIRRRLEDLDPRRSAWRPVSACCRQPA